MGFLTRILAPFRKRPVMPAEFAKNTTRPVVLVHGYSDEGKSFLPWARVLKERRFNPQLIEVVTYKSLTNEVMIKDLAEGFERALRNKGITGDFDVIVHSTGMLVVRAWLTANRDDRSRVGRLKHLVGFAPATWGSPLAHRGRGLLGSIFKGNKKKDVENAPDFLEAGDLILDGLELASRFTWDLSHQDLFVKEPFYGDHGDTPYPFIFCGNKPYGGIRSVIDQRGTDGTVRFAGVSLDSVKFTVDLTKAPNDPKRLVPATTNGIDAPVIFVDGKNHGTILSETNDTGFVDMVVKALNVGSHDEYRAWREAAKKWSQPPDVQCQQFIIHMTDERGDPIHDYHIELFSVIGEKVEPLDFDLEMHAYQADKSFRAFHVKSEELQKAKGQLWMRITLSSGTILVAYRGISTKGFPGATDRAEMDALFQDTDLQRNIDTEPTELNLELTPYRDGIEGKPKLFFPFTTTLVEIKVDREPLPFGAAVARLCRFEDLKALRAAEG
jgi:hypothetical protein